MRIRIISISSFVIVFFLSILIGRKSIDALVDANLSEFFTFLITVILGTTIGILGIILWKKKRWLFFYPTLTLISGFLIGFFAWILIVPNYGMHVKWNEEVGIVKKNLSYGESSQNTYDLYLPKKKTKDNFYGLVLYIHGGGFSSGSKEDGETWSKYMTSKGYVSASINYSLLVDKNNSSINKIYEEIKESVAAIKKESNKLNYPISEMAVSGESAGGALALIFAYKIKKNSPIPIKFVFQKTGPASFNPVLWGTLNQDYESQEAFIKWSTGYNVTKTDIIAGKQHKLIEGISPANLVSKDTVPTLTAYGPNDKMVPPQLKFYLFDSLERYNIPYHNVDFPKSNHGLYDDPQSQKEYLKRLDEFFETYFEHKPLY